VKFRETKEMNFDLVPGSRGDADCSQERQRALAEAKARVQFAAFTARLKSCPVTEQQDIE